VLFSLAAPLSTGGRTQAYLVLDVEHLGIVIFRLTGPANERTHLDYPNSSVDVADTTDGHPATAEPTRIVVVADVRLYREGLAATLAARSGLRVLGTAAAREAAVALVAGMQPDVVVVDMATRDIVRDVGEQATAAKVLAFGVDESERDIVACAEAGVAAYLARDGSIEDLLAAIASCTRGELLCSPRIAATLLRRVSHLAAIDSRECPALTCRERQIIGLIDGGLSNKEIAQRLSIEVATVKNHVHNILDKLKVTTRAEAAACLRKHRQRDGQLRVATP